MTKEDALGVLKQVLTRGMWMDFDTLNTRVERREPARFSEVMFHLSELVTDGKILRSGMNYKLP